MAQAREQQHLTPELRDPECKPAIGVYYAVREHSIVGIVCAKKTELFTR
jgi:hypothetical protein